MPGPPIRLFLLDNYDSFTWNLAQYFEELGARVDVVLNDAISAGQVLEADYDAWVVSPGPGRPEQAGISLELVHAAPEDLPLLGVCLGHQAMARAAGGRVVRAPSLMHGKTSEIHHDGTGVFANLPPRFEATRYHSLVVEPNSLPSVFEVNAFTDAGVIMGMRHRSRPQHGVQFHPESIMTPQGKRLLENFLALVRHEVRRAV